MLGDGLEYFTDGMHRRRYDDEIGLMNRAREGRFEAVDRVDPLGDVLMTGIQIVSNDFEWGRVPIVNTRPVSQPEADRCSDES
ncbi:hypothetical protein NITHO_1070003 [Nitrolancea hollandica Lb]|uniref:Uncharacterized protein n=1 Tax=Nitrolancea hollandica Lb TaxID=1129897 RepID=I4ECJ7_9BACT|nr:hypothetical protein NITHO_1070003 [Nitrolancea hollandica Lb]